MKERDVGAEEAMRQMQKIFQKLGRKALEMAKKEALQEKIECKEAREALSYFMSEYWHDLARPSLLALSCEAVGGDPKVTIPIAIPMILMSGAMDIHDDIIDQSKIKNGKPTVYGKYGKDMALLVGDALLFKGLMLLNKTAEKEISSEKMRIIMNVVKNMFFELGDAEALELQFRGNLDVSPQDYLRVVRKKAADVEAHTRISAILGDASPKKIEALGEYGRLLGMLILLSDDWTDLFDTEESVSRIKKESLPLPLLYGLQYSSIKDKLKTIFRKKTITKRDVELILESIRNTDISEKYAKLMSDLAEEAASKLRKQRVNSKDLDIIIKATLAGLKETKTGMGSRTTT